MEFAIVEYHRGGNLSRIDDGFLLQFFRERWTLVEVPTLKTLRDIVDYANENAASKLPRRTMQVNDVGPIELLCLTDLQWSKVHGNVVATRSVVDISDRKFRTVLEGQNLVDRTNADRLSTLVPASSYACARFHHLCAMVTLRKDGEYDATHNRFNAVRLLVTKKTTAEIIDRVYDMDWFSEDAYQHPSPAYDVLHAYLLGLRPRLCIRVTECEHSNNVIATIRGTILGDPSGVTVSVMFDGDRRCEDLHEWKDKLIYLGPEGVTPTSGTRFQCTTETGLVWPELYAPIALAHPFSEVQRMGPRPFESFLNLWCLACNMSRCTCAHSRLPK